MNRLPVDHAGSAAGVLIRDDVAWGYHGYDDRPAYRRLRVWRMGPKAVVAVLTEPADAPGTSITNAAPAIRLKLEREYPTDLVLHIEHYPADSLSGEHWDLVDVDPGGGAAHWQRLDPQDLAARLPRLIEVPLRPSDPPPDGIDALMWRMTAGLDRRQLGELARAILMRRTQMGEPTDG